MISRIFRGENENAAVKRKRQIDTLKIFNDNVVELREDVEYQVEFTAGDRRMAIMVSLSPEFPLEKPVLRVSPPISHPWCNEHSEITSAPGLLNFTVHSDLGRVVQAIIREFSKNPPQLQEDLALASNLTHRDLQERVSPSYSLQQRYPEHPSTSYNSYYNSQYPHFSSPTQNSGYKYNFINTCDSQPFATSSNPVQYSYMNSHYGNSSYSSPQQQPISTASTEFPELNKLSNEELKRLGEDDDSLDCFLEEHSRLKDINLAIDEAIDCVEKIATDNLAKETELKRLKEEITSKVTAVSVLKSHCDNLIHQYNKLSEVFVPDNIRVCLKQAADDSYEKSEKIAEDFLNKKIDVERFLTSYIECRKLGQARRTKEEKLAHQLNELKRAGY